MPMTQLADADLGVSSSTAGCGLSRHRFPTPREGDVKMLTGRLTRSECYRAARVLQSHLDGEVDDPTAAMVTSHKEFCRRCGLEASTYRAIKTVIASIGPGEVDAAAVSRLRAFASDLEAPQDGRDR